MQLILTASPRSALAVLLWLRALAVAGQAVTVCVALAWLRIDIPLGAVAALIAALALAALLTGLRLRWLAWPCTQLELALQLGVDVAQLALLLYLCGGVTNPFASLLLVPIAFAAVSLAWWYTGLAVACCVTVYLFLHQHFQPLAYQDPDSAAQFNLHILGMIVNFVLSAVLIGSVLAAITAQGRRREAELALLRETALQRDHLASLGLLAAGAAHELGTPLATIAVLASELEERAPEGFRLREDLALLRSQVRLCKQRLGELLRLSGHERAPEASRGSLRASLEEVMQGLELLHPRVRFALRWPEGTPDPLVRIEPGLVQALRSLLDNAASAGAAGGGHVEVGLLPGGSGIYIDDDGPGLSAEARRYTGHAVFSTKAEGLGLGIMLSNANLDRLGGRVTWHDRPDGGTRAAMHLPAGLWEDTHG